MSMNRRLRIWCTLRVQPAIPSSTVWGHCSARRGTWPHSTVPWRLLLECEVVTDLFVSLLPQALDSRTGCAAAIVPYFLTLSYSFVLLSAAQLKYIQFVSMSKFVAVTRHVAPSSSSSTPDSAGRPRTLAVRPSVSTGCWPWSGGCMELHVYNYPLYHHSVLELCCK
jgi:hypothetical protein